MTFFLLSCQLIDYRRSISIQFISMCIDAMDRVECFDYGADLGWFRKRSDQIKLTHLILISNARKGASGR